MEYNRATKNLLSIILVTVMVMSLFTVSLLVKGNDSYAATSNVTLSGVTKPGTLKLGTPFVIKGTISSALTMTRVEIGIVKNDKWVSDAYYNKAISSKTFNIFNADSSIPFGSLTSGTYYYRIWVHDANGSHRLLNHQFTVSTAKAASKITLSGVAKPGTLTIGQNYTVKGTVNSSLSLKQMSIGIATANGKTWIANHVIYKYPKVLTFNIGNVASQLKFNDLAVGSYRYKVWAYDANGSHLIIDQPFTVQKKISNKISLSKLKNYASKNYNKKNNKLCAEFAWDCLKNAGYSIPVTKVTNTLKDKYTSTKVAAPAQLQYFVNKKTFTIKWNPKYQSVSKSWIKNNIKPGDLVYTTPKKYFNKKYAVHVLVCYGKNSKGEPLYAARNTNRYGKTITWFQSGNQKVLAVVKTSTIVVK